MTDWDRAAPKSILMAVQMLIDDDAVSELPILGSECSPSYIGPGNLSRVASVARFSLKRFGAEFEIARLPFSIM